ncbi:MAG: nucleotidyltransferase domain-containing protein [bacterium]|nr:nucleotidyltransferase domain-containing protein [bacterium]
MSRSMYESEIAREAKISKGGANQTLKELFKIGFLIKEKRGRMHFYSLNLTNPVIKQLKILEVVIEINPIIDKLKEFSREIIIYGSCAQGKDLEDSDIDLFIVTNEKDKTRRLIRDFNLTTKEIKPTILNNQDLAFMKKEDNAFYNEVMKGIVLWRAESEY